MLKKQARAGEATSKPARMRDGVLTGWGRAFLALALSAFSTFGANHFVTVSGAGAKNGSDWSNAYAGLPGTLVRGDVYYLAGGDYGAGNFTTANSGSAVITIRAATAASHGTDTGWTSGLATPVLFSSPCNVTSDYWLFDGQSRGGWTSGYNLRFVSGVLNGNCVSLTGRNYTGISFQYCEFYGTHGAVANSSESSVYIYPACDNFYMGYCWVHETGGDSVMANFGGGSGTGHTYEYCWIAKNHQEYNSDHSQGLAEACNNLTVRYCVMQDIISSGFITDPTPGAPPISNWEIYGNVFFWDAAFASDSRNFCSDGIVGFFGESYSGHFYFYNNTISGIMQSANLHNAGFYSIPASASSRQIYNNVWYNCDSIEGFAGGGTADYNSFYTYQNPNGLGAHDTFSASGNPFVSVAGYDFHLTAASAAGTAVAAPYNMDMEGNVRGADGVWDRGAYEFGGIPSTNPPVISAVQATSVSDRSATLVWTTDKSASSLVQYGLTTAYGSTASNSTLTTSHSLTVTNLNPSTTYHYLVKSTDSAGHVGSSADFTLTTAAPDTTPPTVSLTAPAQNALLAGVAMLTANAADNLAVAGVQFLVDGKPAGAEVLSAPYALAWNSASASNGIHSVQARARDAAGNTATSASVSVQVQNLVTTGLAGYWNFNEGSGTTAADSTTNGDTATLNAGATWGTGILSTSALLLNGTASVTVPDSAALRASGDLSIGVWVKHNALPGTNSWMYYVEKGLNNQENYAIGAYNDGTGTRLFFEFVDSTGASRYYTQGTGPALAAGIWAQVTIVFDHTHSQLTFYINGQPAASAAVAQSLAATTNPLLIGQQNIGGYEFYLNGLLDDLRIYNRPLAAAEVSSLANVNKPAAPTGLKVLASNP